jgi:hypothetical protein
MRSTDIAELTDLPDDVIAMWEDLEMGIEHGRAWKRIALVTDVGWMSHMRGMFGWMTPGEVEHVPLSARIAAIAWAAG